MFVADIPTVQSRYNASKELATLTISLYVVGLGCGPFVFAPLSELYGRQRGYVISMIGPFTPPAGLFTIRRQSPRLTVTHVDRLHVHEPRMLLRRQVSVEKIKRPPRYLQYPFRGAGIDSHSSTCDRDSLPGFIVLRL